MKTTYGFRVLRLRFLHLTGKYQDVIAKRPKHRTITRAERRFFHKGLAPEKIPFEQQKRVKGASGKSYRVDGLVAKMLVTEIDGGVHETPEQHMRDLAKDKDLRAAGLTVIRFPNHEVYGNLAGCVHTVKTLLKRINEAEKGSFLY